jgi:hypothetical protein
VLVPAPEPSKLLARCAECRPSVRQVTHEVAAPHRLHRARKRTSGPREVRQSKSGPHAAWRWSPVPRGAIEVRETTLGWNPGGTAGAGRGGHPGHKARGDHWGGLASRRSSSTYSGEGGPNEVNRGTRLTKKI